MARRSVPSTRFLLDLMHLMSQYDLFAGEIQWDKHLHVWIPANDLLVWGSADGEELEEADFPLLYQCFTAVREASEAKDDDYGGTSLMLYCCRKAGMRPQGAFYDHILPLFWPLFDACGPKREVKFGNPCAHPSDRTDVEILWDQVPKEIMEVAWDPRDKWVGCAQKGALHKLETRWICSSVNKRILTALAICMAPGDPRELYKRP